MRRSVWSVAAAVFLGAAVCFLGGPAAAQEAPAAERPRVREAGIVIGALPPGPLNAITDVEGVRVGHVTLREGDSLRTGVTAILPHGGDLFRRPVPAAIEVGNGFGKLLGSTQVNELGEIETPILLTGTLSVFRAADALVDTLLAIPLHGEVVSRSSRSCCSSTRTSGGSASRSARLRTPRPAHRVRSESAAASRP